MGRFPSLQAIMDGRRVCVDGDGRLGRKLGLWFVEGLLL